MSSPSGICPSVLPLAEHSAGPSACVRYVNLGSMKTRHLREFLCQIRRMEATWGHETENGSRSSPVSMLLFTADAGAAVSHQVTGPGRRRHPGFWTAARVAAALKRDPDSALNAASSPDRHPVATHHRPVTVYRPEVGKILAWDRNIGEFSRSGSIIDTRSLRLVLTAGHCVYADGVWARRHFIRTSRTAAVRSGPTGSRPPGCPMPGSTIPSGPGA